MTQASILRAQRDKEHINMHTTARYHGTLWLPCPAAAIPVHVLTTKRVCVQEHACPYPTPKATLGCMRVCIQQISTGIEVTGKARGNCGSFPSCNNPVAAKQVLLGGQEYAGNFKPLLIAAGLA